ncbi:MAG: efflux RND transporter periplasmic adaptor subunit [Candidatus Binataceae bacterium]|nr:efflux RND transporter periplasmic adaptor subunit [Candidatus Binataceae bacterium]
MKRISTIMFLALILSGTLTPAGAADNSSPALAPIQLTPARRQLIGLTFATVQRRAVDKSIETTGNIEPDEQLQAYVQTRFAGWIKQVFADQSYQYVRRGQPLFTIYSPDLASTEQEYLLALEAQDRVADSTVAGVAAGAKSLTAAAADRLALLGIPRREIARLARERRVREVLTIYSPAAGYIVERNALPNMYVQPDTKLYSITSFSTVWIYAAVFQDEIGLVRAGDRALLTIDAYPGESFAGAVDYIWPQIDTVTRTARVRIAFKNSAGKLKPGMYGRVRLGIPMGYQTVIPAGGVLRTGMRNIAFIDRGSGYLTPVKVELGPRVDDQLIVYRGLRAGDRIVASANFLIDSESQIQAAAGTFAPPPAGVSANAAQPSAHDHTNPAATLEIVTIPNPPVSGRNRISARLKDSHGNPIAGAHISVTFSMAAMPAMGMAAMRVQATLTDRANGDYTGNFTLPGGGTWQVTAVATKNDETIASRQFDLSAAGGM